MNNDQVMSLVRTGLKIGGTVLASFGVMSSGQVDTFVSAGADLGGAVLALVGIISSWNFHKA